MLQAYLGTCLYISHELYCLDVRQSRKYDTDTQEYQYSHQSSSLKNVNRILDTLLTVRLLKTHKKSVFTKDASTCLGLKVAYVLNWFLIA